MSELLTVLWILVIVLGSRIGNSVDAEYQYITGFIIGAISIAVLWLKDDFKDN